jgi:glycerol-3-phosphate acyltransferase PlsX
MFIGVDGIVIKSHGSSDAIAFNNAIEAAIKLVKQDINTDISEMVTNYYSNELRSSLVSKIKTKLGFN